MPDNDEKPREKGLGEYTRDFVSGLFGRKDEEDEEKKEAAQAQEDGPMNQTALKAAEEARQRAAEQAREDAAEKARDAREAAAAKARNDAAHNASESLAERIRDQAAAAAESVKPQAQQASRDDKLEELERLRDRVKELESDAAVAQQAAPAQRTYTVVSGDSLSLIAKRYYGDPMKWKRIYEANRDKIQDPDLIYPGQEFIIPE